MVEETIPQLRRKIACLIVMGDIGRSPRMQYHAQSLLNENYNVEMIGYIETQPLDCLLEKTVTVLNNKQLKIHNMSQFPDIMNLPKTLKYFFKTIWQALTLLIALITIIRPNFLLIQNPPAIPTIFICWLYCTITRTKYIIDWHNYTYSILELNTKNSKNFIVRLAKWIEYYFGKKAVANFCVTKAMKSDLAEKWGINATVLYDRPSNQFQTITLEQKHAIFMKLSKEYSQFLPKTSNCNEGDDSTDQLNVMESTAFTQKLQNGTIIYQKQRPAILISSTSWTPDENFSILLDALIEYDEFSKTSNTLLPNLLCIITGKGPQKDEYIEQISKMNFHKIEIITPWLEANDYPIILGAADLGVCLHYSSSGLDLPMKIVDMFGCGLPVCAINFYCLNELVVHGQNGFVFDTSTELAEQLQIWFETFPNNLSLTNTKEIFRKNLQKFQSCRWKENWNLTALPILNGFT